MRACQSSRDTAKGHALRRAVGHRASSRWLEARRRRGDEIGNHSLTHSCSGNFAFSRQKALEEHSIPRMRDELIEANRRIATLLGVTPRTFACPCGQTFVGRGPGTQSYVPVVADLFLAGRGWRDESSSHPAFVDRRRPWASRWTTATSPRFVRGWTRPDSRRLARARRTRHRRRRSSDDAHGDARRAPRLREGPVERHLACPGRRRRRGNREA